MKRVGAAANGLLALAVALVPPLALSVWAWPQVLRLVDAQLASAKPLIEHEVSLALTRPVKIGKIAPELSLASLKNALGSETLTVTAENIELGCRDDEKRWAGQGWLARIPRTTALIAPAALQSGKLSESGVLRIDIERPELLLYRTQDGKLSLESFLPKPKTAPDQTQPPFQTQISVRGGRLRFRDYASLRAPGKPEDNALERLSATVDLTGTRTIRFAARAFPTGQTKTRLDGPLEIAGTARRGEHSSRPDSPAPNQPFLSLQANLRNADIAYWLSYALKPRPDVQLTRGRANAQLALLLTSPTETHPTLLVESQFVGVDVVSQQPKRVAFTNLMGSATYDGDAVSGAVRGSTLGESFLATGRLAGLESKSPQVAATLTMPRVPLQAALALAPQLKLPKELKLGSTVRLEGVTLTGALLSPQATARFSGLVATWKGLPTLTAAASLTYSQGTIEAPSVAVSLAGGGILTGKGRYTLKSQSGAFEVHLRKAELGRVALLKTGKFAPSGLLAADIQGTIQKDILRGTGLLQTTQLKVAGLEFPTASAQLVLQDKRYQVVDGVLAGTSGVLRLRGSGTLGETLDLSAHLVAADLGKLTVALGIPGVGGTVSASAQLTGTEKAPNLLVRDVTILQPHYQLANQVLVADAAHIERAVVRMLPNSKMRIELDPMQPLRITHSPALAQVYGTITSTMDTTRLNLTASVENLEVDEILAQLSDEPGRFAPEWLRHQQGYQKLLGELNWTGVPKPPISGFVRSAKATLTGDARNPDLQGDVTLGRFLLGDFPIEGGTFVVTQKEGNLRVQDLQLTTATGKVTGGAQLARSGALSGVLLANSIDLEAASSLAGLAQKQLGITGALSATLSLAGTREHPLVTAKLTEARPIQIAGVPLTELDFGEILLTTEITPDAPLQGSITLPSASVRLGSNSARVAVSELRYDLESQRFSGSFAIEAGFQKVVEQLRHAQLDTTLEGRDFIRSLYSIPTTLDATASLTGTIALRMTPKGPRERSANLRLATSNLTIQPEGSAGVQGQLTARATLSDERLTLDSANLTLTDPNSDEPTILRLLSHASRDLKTGEAIPSKSWLRLPYDSDEPLEYHLTLDTNAIPLNLISTLAPNALPIPVQGKASVTVEADGTPETPRVTASFFGDNLLIGETKGRSGEFNAPPFLVNQLRFQVELIGKNKQDWSVALADGRLTHDKEVLTFSGMLPYDRSSNRVAAARPIRLQAAIDEGIGLTLETLSQYFQTNRTQLTGTLRGNVELTGSLNEPRLGGKLVLSDASARFPNPRQPGSREVINPIQRFDLVAELSGREVRFPKAELVLAAVPAAVKPERGKKPTLEPTSKLAPSGRLTLDPNSVIRLENLEDFTRIFGQQGAVSEPVKLRGEFDLKARFTDFQIDTDNASALLMSDSLTRSIGGGLEEAFKGKINGQLTIKGPLLTPTIATTTGSKLSLADLSFRIPRRQLPETSQNTVLVFNPRFAVALETSNDARLTNPDRLTGFEFKGNGGVTISGDQAAPKIEGLLNPTGGFYQYPLSRFTVQRGGEIRLTYAKRLEAGQDRLQLDIKMDGVVAEGKVLVSASAVKSAQSSPAVFDPSRASNQIPDDLIGKRITITANFNGVVRMGDPTRDASRPQANPIKLTSDANLSEFTLLSLLVPYQMLSQFVGNKSQQAIQDSFNMLGSGLAGAFITPVTDQISRLFGLDSFSVDYSLTGLSNFFFMRRLPEPLDKVTIEVRRSFQTRSGSGQLLPQRYSINYEIGQLQRGSRLQLGASTNEQRDNQLFLRGAFRY